MSALNLVVIKWHRTSSAGGNVSKGDLSVIDSNILPSFDTSVSPDVMDVGRRFYVVRLQAVIVKTSKLLLESRSESQHGC